MASNETNVIADRRIFRSKGRRSDFHRQDRVACRRRHRPRPVGRFASAPLLPAAAKVGVGAAPGDYVVIIEKVDAPPPETFAPDDPRYGRAQPPAPKITSIVPQSYSVRETTPFKATVKKGENTFTFEVDSKKP